jgi:hypothetical protein
MSLAKQKRTLGKFRSIFTKPASSLDGQMKSGFLADSLAAVNAALSGKPDDDDIQYLLSPSIPMQMLQAHAESTARCIELSDENDR